MFFYLPFYATMLKNTKDYKMIICVANEKGGSGKSNIAINLAIKLHSLKEYVLLNAFANGMGVVEFAKKDDNVLKDFESFFNELVSFCQSKTNKKSKKRIKNERVK